MIPGRKVQTDGIESEIVIDAGKVELEGTLGIPKETAGIVLYCTWQREQSPQPAEPLRCAGASIAGNWNAALRSFDA